MRDAEGAVASEHALVLRSAIRRANVNLVVVRVPPNLHADRLTRGTAIGHHARHRGPERTCLAEVHLRLRVHDILLKRREAEQSCFWLEEWRVLLRLQELRGEAGPCTRWEWPWRRCRRRRSRARTAAAAEVVLICRGLVACVEECAPAVGLWREGELIHGALGDLIASGVARVLCLVRQESDFLLVASTGKALAGVPSGRRRGCCINTERVLDGQEEAIPGHATSIKASNIRRSHAEACVSRIRLVARLRVEVGAPWHCGHKAIVRCPVGERETTPHDNRPHSPCPWLTRGEAHAKALLHESRIRGQCVRHVNLPGSSALFIVEGGAACPCGRKPCGCRAGLGAQRGRA